MRFPTRLRRVHDSTVADRLGLLAGVGSSTASRSSRSRLVPRRFDRVVQIAVSSSSSIHRARVRIQEQRHLDPVGRPSRARGSPTAARRARGDRHRSRRRSRQLFVRVGTRRRRRVRRSRDRLRRTATPSRRSRRGRRRPSMSRRSASCITYWSRTSSLGCSATIAAAACRGRARPSMVVRSAAANSAVEPELEERLACSSPRTGASRALLPHVAGVAARTGGRLPAARSRTRAPTGTTSPPRPGRRCRRRRRARRGRARFFSARRGRRRARCHTSRPRWVRRRACTP